MRSFLAAEGVLTSCSFALTCLPGVLVVTSGIGCSSSLDGQQSTRRAIATNLVSIAVVNGVCDSSLMILSVDCKIYLCA